MGFPVLYSRSLFVSYSVCSSAYMSIQISHFSHPTPQSGNHVERRNTGPVVALVTGLDSPKALWRVTIQGDTAIALNPSKALYGDKT